MASRTPATKPKVLDALRALATIFPDQHPDCVRWLGKLGEVEPVEPASPPPLATTARPTSTGARTTPRAGAAVSGTERLRRSSSVVVVQVFASPDFKRTYYENFTLDRNTLRGAAPVEQLAELAGTGIEVRPNATSARIRQLAGCPPCEVDGTALEVGSEIAIDAGRHRLTVLGLSLELRVSDIIEPSEAGSSTI